MATKRKEGDLGDPPEDRVVKKLQRAFNLREELIMIEISDYAPAYFHDRAEEIKTLLAQNWDDHRLPAYTSRSILSRPGCFRVRTSNTGFTFWEHMDMVHPFQPLVDLDVTDLVARIVQSAGIPPRGIPKELILIEMSVDADPFFGYRAQQIKRELKNYWDAHRLAALISSPILNGPGCFRVRARTTGYIFWQHMDMVAPFQPLYDLNVKNLVAGIIEADRAGALISIAADQESPRRGVYISMSSDGGEVFDTKAEEIKEGYLIQSRGRVFVFESRDEDKPGCFIVRNQDGHNFCQLRDMVEPYQPLVELDVNNIVSQIIEFDVSCGQASPRRNEIYIDMSSDSDGPNSEVFDDKAKEIEEGLMKSGASDRVLVTVIRKLKNPAFFIVRSKNGYIFCELKDMEEPFQPLKDLDVKDVVNQVVQAITVGTI